MSGGTDRGFVKWVQKAALALLLVFVPLAGLYGKKVVLGYGLGGAIGLAMLWSHQWLAARAFERGAQGLRRPLLGLWLLKYPALVAVLYFAVARRAVSPAALCVGLGLVPFAMVIKILGGTLRRASGSGREG
jgi:hypothetical protein